MGKRNVVDAVRVLAVYGETGSNRKTARIVGVSENTVLQVRRRAAGLCNRCGRATEGFSNCPDCREWLKDRAKTNRTKSHASGTCVMCTEPVVPGLVHCAEHRQAVNEKAGRNRIASPPKKITRPKAIFNAYGMGGVQAWARSGGQCVLCDDAGDKKRKIHIHHIDVDRSNNATDNLVCLCWSCHRLVHLLMEHPEPRRVLVWLRANKPEVALD